VAVLAATQVRRSEWTEISSATATERMAVVRLQDRRLRAETAGAWVRIRNPSRLTPIKVTFPNRLTIIADPHAEWGSTSPTPHGSMGMGILKPAVQEPEQARAAASVPQAAHQARRGQALRLCIPRRSEGWWLRAFKDRDCVDTPTRITATGDACW
jgi:hypothetical protein